MVPGGDPLELHSRYDLVQPTEQVTNCMFKATTHERQESQRPPHVLLHAWPESFSTTTALSALTVARNVTPVGWIHDRLPGSRSLNGLSGDLLLPYLGGRLYPL